VCETNTGGTKWGKVYKRDYKKRIDIDARERQRRMEVTLNGQPTLWEMSTDDDDDDDDDDDVYADTDVH